MPGPGYGSCLVAPQAAELGADRRFASTGRSLKSLPGNRSSTPPTVDVTLSANRSA